MLPVRKANHSRPWSAEDKKEWSYNPHQSTPSQHRENISLLYEQGASCKSKYNTAQNVKELKDAEMAESVPWTLVQFCLHLSSGLVFHCVRMLRVIAVS